MKFGKFVVLFMLLLVSLFSVGAAKTDEVREIIPTGKVVDNNHFFTGDYFENNGTIDGSLFVSASEVLINGDVNENLFIASQNEVVINGHVKGDIFIAAAKKVSITGLVEGSVFVASKNVVLESRAEVARGLYAAGQDVNIYGVINRDANIYASDTVLVKGVIIGDLQYNAGKTTNIVDGSVKGKTIVREVEKQDTQKFTETTTFRLFQTISFIFANLIIWFLFTFIFKETRLKSAKLLQSNRGRLFFLYGVVGLMATLAITVLFMISFIGIPFGLITLFLMLSGIYLSTGVFLVALSDIIGAKYQKYTTGNNILYVLVLSILVSLLRIIPVVGGIVTLFMVITGYGLIVGSFYHKGESEEEHSLIL